MNYFEFTKRFPDEKSAIDFIVEIEQLSGKLCITLILNLPNSIGSKSKCQSIVVSFDWTGLSPC